MNYYQLSVDKFRIKPGEEDLERDDFEYWPVWSEHYDYEEIEGIEKWGVDKQWALDKFKEFDTGGSHPHYTVLDLNNLPLDNIRIYIKAKFNLPNGQELNGYIMNLAELCIGIFGGDKDYLFSNHEMLSDEMTVLHEQAAKEFNVNSLFPLKFETEFRDSDGKPIMGIYKLVDENV